MENSLIPSMSNNLRRKILGRAADVSKEATI